VNEDIALQENCLNLITGNGILEQAKGDSLDPTLFIGKSPRAYIMTPAPWGIAPPDAYENLDFPQAVQTISNTLTSLIPGLEVYINGYQRLEEVEEGKEMGVEGKAVFEYDPDSEGTETATAPGIPNFRLWLEQNCYNGIDLGIMPSDS
jgi:hypothetical protein